jgi:3-oxoacyl-[acyl-carrier protein] reductase
MDLGIKGKAAFVMGGSRGIGRAIARRLAQEGCAVAIAARNAQDVAAEVEWQRSRGHEAIGLVADLSDPGNFDLVLDEMRVALRAPDIAIFTPPTPPAGSFLGLSEDHFARGFNDLVLCFMRLVRRVYPAMAERRWGRIVTVGSTVIKQPARGALGFDYALANITRVAAASASKTIAAELAPHGITVNTIATGSIGTDMGHQFFATMAERSGITKSAFMELLERQTPVRRIGTPEEMAGLTAYLCSDLAGFTTGEVVSCDGGFANNTL